jgi:hypothetical protein
MGNGFGKWLNLDIPEELYLSRNIQTMMARAAVAGASPDDTAKAILAIVAGNVRDMEQRLIALEKHAGIEPPKPRFPVGG